MKMPDKLKTVFRVPRLTRTRIVVAIAAALVADALQFFLGPAGWIFADQIIDVLVMLLMSRLIGFHWLLLPTFAIEIIPALDDLPTWTACVIAVISLRRREQSIPPRQLPPGPTIDV